MQQTQRQSIVFFTDLLVAWTGNTSGQKIQFSMIIFCNIDFILKSKSFFIALHYNDMNLVLAKVWKIERICTTTYLQSRAKKTQSNAITWNDDVKWKLMMSLAIRCESGV